MDTHNSTVSALKEMMETFKIQIEAGIPLSQDDHNARVKQLDIVEEAQQQIDEGPNSEQAASIVQDELAGQALPPGEQGDNARRLTVEQPSASVGQDIVS